MGDGDDWDHAKVLKLIRQLMSSLWNLISLNVKWIELARKLIPEIMALYVALTTDVGWLVTGATAWGVAVRMKKVEGLSKLLDTLRQSETQKGKLLLKGEQLYSRLTSSNRPLLPV